MNKDRKLRLESASELAYKLRYEFIKDLSNSTIKDNFNVILELAVKVLINDNNYFSEPFFKQLLDLDNLDDMTIDNIERTFVMAIIASLDTSIDRKYNCYGDYWGYYGGNTELDLVYDILKVLGYQMSDEEKALQDGTHDAFKQEG